MKPDWLKEIERKKRMQFLRTDIMCKDCKHFGKPLYKTRYQGKETVYVHECNKHPGCLNTIYSLSCSDWER